LVRQASKLFGLTALVVFDSIEPPAVQVKGLLNFFDSAGQAALLPLLDLDRSKIEKASAVAEYFSAL
jgi:hypothetical protein